MTHLRAPKRLEVHVLLMGIVNRTPDSFSDGGCFLNEEAARVRVDALIRDGADIIDVGAESTRPGADAVPAEVQKQRLGQLFAYIAAAGAVGSVDTTLPEVAEAALQQGARMVNSVSLEPAAELAAVAARYDADLVLTHCRGSMADMAGFSRYREDGYTDVVRDVLREWRLAAAQAMAAGLPAERLIFDPGLGFKKSATQSLQLCARLQEIREQLPGHRILMGPSRKSYLARTAPDADGALPSANDRLGASLAAALDCAQRGADILRIHDVREVSQALRYLSALSNAQPETAASAITRSAAAHDHEQPSAQVPEVGRV